MGFSLNLQKDSLNKVMSGWQKRETGNRKQETANFEVLNLINMIRNATAVWTGTGKEGKGVLNSDSGVLSQTPYSYNDRFADGKGTNPEELVAAAHAGCFSMKLSFVLGEAGFTPDKLETKCEITFEGGAVTKSHLIVKGTVPNINKQQWDDAVKKAEQTCPISKLLNTTITSEGSLA
jgi:lipoyl-dependent peroxiredoxin